MAKDKTKAEKPKTKAKKADTKGKAKKASAKIKDKGHKGLDAVAKLADHPLVVDLIAIGATAAVAALAERGGATKAAASARSSSTALKAAGTAAANAIGKRLMTEFKAVKDSAADANAKRKV
ncbi:hypothetical protein SH584_03350 [Sphingomonas sp. LY29]|uniref:hypothetical protein n=1 Tax=Sphingomonas sp. LY29 TaxID=3095341 RepID=UPI002D783171|nr:hypothetical protein [Sphingomonas sp. LY29]WRP26487.1 hypothetical protein SH584_03350 [Sphingomonas sp. LY29]